MQPVIIPRVSLEHLLFFGGAQNGSKLGSCFLPMILIKMFEINK